MIKTGFPIREYVNDRGKCIKAKDFYQYHVYSYAFDIFFYDTYSFLPMYENFDDPVYPCLAMGLAGIFIPWWYESYTVSYVYLSSD